MYNFPPFVKLQRNHTALYFLQFYFDLQQNFFQDKKLQGLFLMMVKNLGDDRGPLESRQTTFTLSIFLFQPSEGDRGENIRIKCTKS